MNKEQLIKNNTCANCNLRGLIEADNTAFKFKHFECQYCYYYCSYELKPFKILEETVITYYNNEKYIILSSRIKNSMAPKLYSYTEVRTIPYFNPKKVKFDITDKDEVKKYMDQWHKIIFFK